MKYVIGHTKGGVGKSTNAVHLASELAKEGPTLLIDADPQETAATWAAWRHENESVRGNPTPTTVRLRGKAVLDEGRALSANYLHTVIDAGGRDNAGLRNAFLLADLAIVPIGASGFDAAAMTDLLEVHEVAADYHPELRLKMFLTRIDPRTKDDQEMLKFLQESKLEVLTSRVCERVTFRRATTQGLTIEEIGKDARAIEEMAAFYREVKA